MSDDMRDVFISYGHADADWVRILAENLHNSDLQVFYDEWDIGSGDVLVHKLDEGILNSRSGILIVSPASLSRPWVQAEYAAMMTRAVEGKQRLIPVLLKDAEMPPLLAARVWVEFRNVDGPDYLGRVRELVRELKGARRGPPTRTGEVSLPPGSGFTAVGPRACRLSISPERASFSGNDTEVSGTPPNPRLDIDDLNWRLQRARGGFGTLRDVGHTGPGYAGLEGTLQEAGTRLADAFLPATVTSALAAAVADAERLNSPLQLALDIADPLADLPWETLRLRQTGPLALHPRVELYRRIDIGGSAPALAIPGPLRILVVIGSPEAQNTRGELLDMEAELQRILDATDAPRRAGKAFVHILEQGSIAAIHAALAEERYHVLHVSCHAGPDALLLEDASGQEDRVSAQRLCAEAIPAERAAPLIVLAGCSTGQDAGAAGHGAERLPGLARTLVSRGVPAVIAMQASVGDGYATELIGEVYQALANWQEPHPLAALSHARRLLEQQRVQTPQQRPPEWATPALFCGAGPLPLYNPTDPFEDIKEAPEPVFDPGVVVRRIGDMVGRRREQRLILHALRDATQAGVLIHGIGGVGKTTLAAQILHRLADDDDFLMISVKGEVDPDRVLGAIGLRLLSIVLSEGADERDPRRQLANVLREPKYPWRDRFEFLAQNLLNSTRVAFFFDNFEDNLKDGAPPNELAAMLARWLQSPGSSRLVFTSRYPFKLPDDAQDRLQAFHLGPLSWAETRKLLWRLEGLRVLSPKEQRRAYEQVGGHPRALEYLEAILRGDKARFPDVQTRLRRQLAEKGIRDPARWCADTAGGLDAALAETVTLAADDVLLDQLLDQLKDEALARRLLIGAAVYRVPVNEIGLIWMVGEPAKQISDPARTGRLQQVQQRLNEARKENPLTELREILESPEEIRQLQRDFAEEGRSPMEAPEHFASAVQKLLDLSLLAPVQFADSDENRFLVHRWTAGALARFASQSEQADAHRAAVSYWRWRVTKLPQSRENDIEDLLEARYHLRAIGDISQFHVVSTLIIEQLDTWGAWEWEERLIRETLGLMPDVSSEASVYLNQLGMVAQNSGNYDGALEWYSKSLAIEEQLGNRPGMAIPYHQLGVVAQERGDYDAALDWYSKSLAIKEQLGDRAGIANSHHQLGNVSCLRGDFDAGLDWYLKSLAVYKQLGDRARMSASYHQLGIVAEHRRDYEAALDWYRQSLAIDEQLGNRVGVAGAYHQLGVVASACGDYDAALDWYRKALAIFEQLGDRAGMARSYHNLGMVAQDRSDYDAAIDWYRKSLAIKEQLGDRAGMATSYGQIGALYTQTGRTIDGVPFNLRSLSLHLEMQSPQATTNLRLLSQQRSILGAEAFRAILTDQLEAEGVTSILETLDEFEAAQTQPNPAPVETSKD
jgi:tetratricopeptide (TPR) repeat protein